MSRIRWAVAVAATALISGGLANVPSAANATGRFKPEPSLGESSSFTVPGTANLFGANHSLLPAPGGGGAGSAPISIPLPIGSAGQSAAFSMITGSVSLSGNPSVGPDGGYDGHAIDIDSYGGISGMVGGTIGASLDAVFTGPDEPADPAPSRLNYSTPVSQNSVEYRPLLNQSFFVGDAVNDSGVQQTFVVPDGATTLWLGLEDAPNLDGLPGTYDPNTGSFAGAVSIQTSQPVQTVSAPEFKVVRYIHSFSVNRCANSILVKFPYVRFNRALLVCATLGLSRNRVPARDIATSPEKWEKFLKAGQFRVAMSIPSATITCIRGTISALRLGGATQLRFGYTPGPDGTHIPGQPYKGDGGRWKTGELVTRYSPDRSLVTMDLKGAVAASFLESSGNGALLGRALPFVWTDMKETLGCNGYSNTEITYSDMPTIDTYRGGSFIDEVIQTPDWGKFLAAGQPIIAPTPPGYGVLDPYCGLIRYSPSSTSAPSDLICLGPPV